MWSQIQNFAIKVAYFLRLIDEDSKLSLTNIAVMIVLAKLLFTKNAIAPVDIGALIGTLFSYQGKRLIQATTGTKVSVDVEQQNPST